MTSVIANGENWWCYEWNQFLTHSTVTPPSSKLFVYINKLNSLNAAITLNPTNLPHSPPHTHTSFDVAFTSLSILDYIFFYRYPQLTGNYVFCFSSWPFFLSIKHANETASFCKENVFN